MRHNAIYYRALRQPICIGRVNVCCPASDDVYRFGMLFYLINFPLASHDEIGTALKLNCFTEHHQIAVLKTRTS